ncbi:MAG: APC family permease [Solobacterium sp.]|nr:APC family permease [Solobacterium sp.]
MKKKLNLFDLISLGVGTIIGSGIFSLLGYGIAYTGRSIIVALFLAMFLVVMQSIRYPILTSIFELKGGMYGISSMTNPKVCAGFDAASDLFFKIGTSSVTCLALVEYMIVLMPGIGAYKKLAAAVLLTVFYIIAAVGDKFAAKVQNLMVILMYLALGLFVVYGLKNYNPDAYAGEPFIMNGFTAFMSATALMSYTCNGFQYVINMGEAAERPKRDIPLGFFLSAFVAAAIYALIGFAATHAFSYGEIAGQNLGFIAKLMMPNSLYNFFVIGGAMFALGTSLLGGIASGYRPVQAAAKDGWWPEALAHESRFGVPNVYFLLYILSLVPILAGIDLNDLAAMSLIPSGILGAITNFYAMKVPETYAKQWNESTVKMSPTMYRFLLVIASIASLIIAYYAFSSNSFKVPATIITIAIFAYGYIRSRSDRINIQAKQVYTAE